MHAFILKIREVLTVGKISQTKLAKGVGFSQQAVNKWLTGETEISAVQLHLVAKYLNFSMDWVFDHRVLQPEDKDFVLNEPMNLYYKSHNNYAGGDINADAVENARLKVQIEALLKEIEILKASNRQLTEQLNDRQIIINLLNAQINSSAK